MDPEKYREAIRAWLDGADVTYIYNDGTAIDASSVEVVAEALSDIRATPKPVAHVHAAAITEWIKNPADWNTYYYMQTAEVWVTTPKNPNWVTSCSYKITSKSTGKEIISHGQC